MSGKAFIQTFHSKHPGATTLALSGAKDAQGRSSYDLLAALADEVPRKGQILDVACGDGYLLQNIRAPRESAEALLVPNDRPRDGHPPLFMRTSRVARMASTRYGDTW